MYRKVLSSCISNP